MYMNECKHIYICISIYMYTNDFPLFMNGPFREHIHAYIYICTCTEMFSLCLWMVFFGHAAGLKPSPPCVPICTHVAQIWFSALEYLTLAVDVALPSWAPAPATICRSLLCTVAAAWGLVRSLFCWHHIIQMPVIYTNDGPVWCVEHRTVAV